MPLIMGIENDFKQPKRDCLVGLSCHNSASTYSMPTKMEIDLNAGLMLMWLGALCACQTCYRSTFCEILSPLWMGERDVCSEWGVCAKSVLCIAQFFAYKVGQRTKRLLDMKPFKHGAQGTLAITLECWRLLILLSEVNPSRHPFLYGNNILE